MLIRKFGILALDQLAVELDVNEPRHDPVIHRTYENWGAGLVPFLVQVEGFLKL